MGKRQQLLALLAIALLAPACGSGGGGKKVPGTVVVTLISADNHTTEDGTTKKAQFTVVLGKKPTKDVQIHLHSSNTAEGDVDKADLTFTSVNWNVAQTVTVTGINDDVDDGDIAYTIILDPCVSLDLTYNAVDPADVDLINEDDDTAGFDFQNILGLGTTESGGQAHFQVRLTSQPTGDVTLTLASDDALKGTVSPTTLTFTVAGGADNWNNTHDVTLTGVDDTTPLAPGPHTWHVTFGASSSTDTLYNNITPASIAVSNADNDTPGITVSPNTGLVSNESGTGDTFTVVLNALPAADVTVTLTTSDANAGLLATVANPTPASTQVLTFTTLNWNVTQSVTLHGVNDALPKKNAAVPYTITVDTSCAADPTGYDLVADVIVNATNTDDDVPGITVTPAGPLVTSEANGPNHTATFTVQLDTIPTAAVRLTITSSNTNEGTVDVATIDYAADDAAALNTTLITITGVQDLVIDPDTQYTITVHVDPITADASYLALGDKTITVTNQDDDAPGFTLSANATLLVTTEAAGQDTFSVALASIPSSDVTVTLSVTLNPSEVQITTPGTLTLTFLGNDISALTPQNVILTGQDDLVLDPNTPFEITGTASSSDTNYNGKTFTASGINSDDEVPPIPGSGPWTTSPTAGVPVGAGGSWNSKSSQEPCVIKTAPTTYHMWFEGANASGAKHEQIGHATSSDGQTWTIDAAPVFNHSGTVGKFDRNGVGDPTIIKDGSTYRMWYAGKDTGTKNKIGYATSLDGLSWSRQNSGNPVLSTTGGAFDSVAVYGPMVIKDGATLHMLYTGVDGAGVTRIGYATSPATDGVTWTKTPGAVLNVGSAGAWDAAGVKMCGAILDGSTFRMWYVGLNAAGGTQRIGIATAPQALAEAAPGAWTKFAGNAVLSPAAPVAFDDRNLWSPWVIKDPDDGKFKMWYGGENTTTGAIGIGYAEVP